MPISAGVEESSYARRPEGFGEVMAPTLGATDWYSQRYRSVVFRVVSLLIAGSIATDHLMSFGGKFRDSLVVDQLDKLSVSFLPTT